MKLISYEELKPLKGIDYSRQQLRRLQAAGKFPKPIPISAGRSPWDEHEIDAWLEGKKAERDGVAA